MSRARSRVCLQDGLKLDLNSLTRKGFVQRGCYSGVRGIKWTHCYWGEVASTLISADLSEPSSGWLRLQGGGLDQIVSLAAQPRRFGGHQWYLVCPVTGRLVSVLWRPPGAKRFCSRQVWGRQVAYASQFLDRDSRAHHGQSKVSARLCAVGGLDPEDWDFPPKPKWMRWKTYQRYEARFDQYETILDYGCLKLARKLGLK